MNSEEIEQSRFVQYCEMRGYKFTSIPNSTFTRSWSQKAKNKRMGLRAGFPDFVLIANNIFIVIEFKREDGGNHGSPAQREWIAALKAAGLDVAICNGCDEAIAYVQAVVGNSAARHKDGSS